MLKAKGKRGSWYTEIFQNRSLVETLPTVLDYWRTSGMHFVDRGAAGDASSERAQEYASALRSAGRVVLAKGEMKDGVLIRGKSFAIYHVEDVEFSGNGLHMNLVGPRRNIK
jgi:hypothetical protein